MFGLDETENILYQHILHAQEDFRAAQLQVSPKALQYFDPANCKHPSSCRFLVDARLSISSGQLKKNPYTFHWPIKERLEELKVLFDEEATATGNLIGRCLRLDPAHRSTAAELLSDPWFDGVE